MWCLACCSGQDVGSCQPHPVVSTVQNPTESEPEQNQMPQKKLRKRRKTRRRKDREKLENTDIKNKENKQKAKYPYYPEAITYISRYNKTVKTPIKEGLWRWLSGSSLLHKDETLELDSPEPVWVLGGHGCLPSLIIILRKESKVGPAMLATSASSGLNLEFLPEWVRWRMSRVINLSLYIKSHICAYTLHTYVEPHICEHECTPMNYILSTQEEKCQMMQGEEDS